MIPELEGPPGNRPAGGAEGGKRKQWSSTPLSETRHTLSGTHLKTSAKNTKTLKNYFNMIPQKEAHQHRLPAGRGTGAGGQQFRGETC